MILFIYLFLAVLGLHCRVGFSVVVMSRGYSLVEVHRLLIAVASLVGVHRPNSCGVPHGHVEYSQTGDQTHVSFTGRWILFYFFGQADSYHSRASREVLTFGKKSEMFYS